MKKRWLAFSVVFAALAACGQPQASSPMSNRPTVMPVASPPLPANVAAFIEPLLVDAAQRSGAPRAQLQVRSVKSVMWSDGSMGCPQPDRMYTQALVPGWLIEVVGAPGGATLRYHASQRGAWLHCPASRAQAPLPGADEAQK